MPDNGKKAGWVGALAGVAVAVAVIMTTIYEVGRIPTLKTKVENREKQLLSNFESQRKNFVQVSLDILGLKTAHAPKVLDGNTIRESAKCEKYLSVLFEQYDYLVTESIGDISSRGVDNIDFCYLSARILIYRGIDTGDLLKAETQADINDWLGRHEILCKDLKTHYRDNKKLRGLLIMASADSYLEAGEPTTAEKEYLRAVRTYDAASEASSMYNNPKQVMWAPALSAVQSIFERMAVTLRDEQYVDSLRDRIESARPAFPKITEDLDNLPPLLMTVNAAEFYLSIGDRSEAGSLLGAMDEWCNANQEIILGMDHSVECRKYFDNIESLKAYSRMQYYLENPWLVHHQQVAEIKADIDAFDLRECDYTSEIISIPFKQLQAIADCSRGYKTRAKKVHKELQSRVETESQTWYRNGISKPRLILRRIEEEVMKGFNSGTCSY